MKQPTIKTLPTFGTIRNKSSFRKRKRKIKAKNIKQKKLRKIAKKGAKTSETLVNESL